MHEDDRIQWDATDIRMAIKRYFNMLEREDFKSAGLELDFMDSIYREWSYNPLMRRAGVEAIAIIDDFLKWVRSMPVDQQSVNDFTIRRLLK